MTICKKEREEANTDKQNEKETCIEKFYITISML